MCFQCRVEKKRFIHCTVSNLLFKFRKTLPVRVELCHSKLSFAFSLHSALTLSMSLSYCTIMQKFGWVALTTLYGLKGTKGVSTLEPEFF